MKWSQYFLPAKYNSATLNHIAGGKAANLAILKKSGINVPDFFVISTKTFFKQNIVDSRPFMHYLQKHIAAITDPEHPSVAVRSSAPFEDAEEHSFAGQLLSHLHLSESKDVINAIKSIWRSADSDHAKSYGAGADKNGVAVIVQRMIPAQFSGVMFTVDPVSNDESVILIEAIAGDCENLVSGKTAPIKVRYKKEEHSFTIDFTAKDSDVTEFISNRDNLQSLVQLAREIEALFASPQDIEWTFDGKQFWILQSRPVSTFSTAQARIRTDTEGQQWSDYFFAERFTEPVTPLGWSFLKPVIEKNAFQKPLWYLGFESEFKQQNILSLFDGIPHARLVVFQKLYSILPDAFILRDKKQALGLRKSFALSKLLRPLAFVAVRLFCSGLQWFPLYNIFRWREFNRSLDQRLEKRQQNINKDSLKLCIQSIKEMQTLSDSFLAIHSWSITFADIFFTILVRALGVLSPDRFKAELFASGLRNATVSANIDLYKIQLEEPASLERFVRKHGHRAKSLDLAAPTWAEDLAFVQKMSQMLKQSPENPLATFQKNQNEKMECERKLYRILRQKPFPLNYLLVGFFKLLLYFIQQFMLMRENQRNAWHKILATARYAALQCGTHLCSINQLEQPDDIFHVTLAELEYLSKGNNTQLDKRIKARKKDKTGQKPMVAPLSMVSHKAIGIGVSKGRARGRAKVCRSFSEVFNAQRGEILVVPAADPAWSPVFAVVSGMIMETGGVLSHASIVAREYRMPTVTNIKDATRLFQNGDMLEINGETGIVSVLVDKQRREI